MTTDLLPSIEAMASKALDVVSRRGRVYVEGRVGAGRNELLSTISSLEPRAVVLELLQLAEFDAPAVALLEIASQLGTREAWPSWSTGSEEELHELARAAGQRLAEANRPLLIRMPDSWLAVEGARVGVDSLPSRARSLLDGLFQSAATIVLIADAALTSAGLGFHAKARLQLPAHATALDALEQIPWDEYQDTFKELAEQLPQDLTASPLAWRLAVGARALGATLHDLEKPLRSTVPLPDLARTILGQLKGHEEIRAAVRRFMAIRRPIAREDARAVSNVPAGHAPLILECIGYGAAETRVSTVLRAMFSKGLGAAGEEPHAGLAHHYTKSDGAPSPVGLERASLRAWCEKAHHLAHAGDLGAAQWSQLDLVAPNLYWDRGRHLSQVLRDYDGAAQVYQACVKRFPEDDYAWHYWGFNLERLGGGC